MKTVTIAFDVDGTLISTDSPEGYPIANERIRSLLIAFASMKNTSIIVWSGGGEFYAKQVCDAIGVSRYVNKFLSKNYAGKDEGGAHQFKPDIVPDIAIDDIQACTLGAVNLIVREK
jgi:phosphoserine phosphatase